MGEYEAAFLPCTFWLATAFAKIGRTRDAEDILRGVEAVAGPLRLFAEGIDPAEFHSPRQHAAVVLTCRVRSRHSSHQRTDDLTMRLRLADAMHSIDLKRNLGAANSSQVRALIRSATNVPRSFSNLAFSDYRNPVIYPAAQHASGNAF
jgi:hypothetical protein